MERRVGGGAARRAIRGGGDVSTAASLEILERAEHQKNYRAGRGTGTKGSALRNSGGGGWSVEEQLDEVDRLKESGFLDAFPTGAEMTGGAENDIFAEMRRVRDEQADVFAQLMDVEVGFERHVLFDQIKQDGFDSKKFSQQFRAAFARREEGIRHIQDRLKGLTRAIEHVNGKVGAVNETQRSMPMPSVGTPEMRRNDERSGWKEPGGKDSFSPQ